MNTCESSDEVLKPSRGNRFLMMSLAQLTFGWKNSHFQQKFLTPNLRVVRIHRPPRIRAAFCRLPPVISFSHGGWPHRLTLGISSMRRPNGPRRGFTLIELLVVIAII